MAKRFHVNVEMVIVRQVTIQLVGEATPETIANAALRKAREEYGDYDYARVTECSRVPVLAFDARYGEAENEK